MHNELSFVVDPGRQFIEVTGSGIWTAAQAETHFDNLAIALRRMRANAGRALVLVDLREALVQPAVTAAVMSRETIRIYQNRDRVAVICRRALLAMQIKHAAKVYDLATFGDRDEALGWLRASPLEASPRQLRQRIPVAS